MKKIAVGVFAVLSTLCLAAPHSADAQVRPSPGPVVKLIPSFSCAATVNGATGLVTIKKTNAGTVDKTRDVVAVINTPNGKRSAAVCGSAFVTGTEAKVSFSPPATNDKTWIYTCSAQQVSTTTACNPPR